MKLNDKWSRNHPAFGEVLRDWRKKRNLSQLDLSLDLGISAKHLSFVETGRSRPSRELILKISNHLKLPLRHHNALLTSAGFAAVFSEESFESPRMEMINNALDRMLEKHDPYPAFVVNASYDILKINSGFNRLVSLFLKEEKIKKHHNILKLTFDPDGLSQYIQNWDKISQFLLTRVWQEAVSSQNEKLLNLYDELKLNYPLKDISLELAESPLPVLSLSFKKDQLTANFFTTITTMGTALDITTQELKIESLFPLDESTKTIFS